jgi:fermentation-respiration switch protein FrsA (DUF1100 family)
MQFVGNILLSVFFVYGFICLGLFLMQRSIIYKPTSEQLTPSHYGLSKMQELQLISEDGTKIVAWYKPAPKGKLTVVYYHGNAGNLSDRTEKLATLMRQGVGVLALSYRGYGNSEGKPSEIGIYQDARAAIIYLQEHGIKNDHIVLYGESLGSGVAVQMATEQHFRALILESPYTSITDRGKEIYPIFPIHLLLRDTFESYKKIKNVHTPIMIFHGYLDEVMPIHHGKRLLDMANEPKEARFFDQVGHTDFNLHEIIPIAVAFAQRSH